MADGSVEVGTHRIEIHCPHVENGACSKLAGRRVVASISGGKDSAAMSLWLTEQGIEHDRVFADTGWEHAATYEYLRGPLAAKLGPIAEVRSPVGGMREWVAKKGMFPSRVRRYCTEELKVKPLAAFIASLGAPTVNAVGIRAAESAPRSRQPEWEPADDIYGADCLVWRPILRWTEQDVIDIHKRHGLAPNPLYLQGAARVGCWPCIFARKAEIRLLADLDPARVAEMERIEGEVEQAARARAAALGTTLEARGHHAPAWFQARTGGTGECWPIRKVVEWSRTSRGGRQFELFAAEPEDTGCVRWGLCESRDLTPPTTPPPSRGEEDRNG